MTSITCGHRHRKRRFAEEVEREVKPRGLERRGGENEGEQPVA